VIIRRFSKGKTALAKTDGWRVRPIVPLANCRTHGCFMGRQCLSRLTVITKSSRRLSCAHSLTLSLWPDWVILWTQITIS